jgi:carbamoyltransferase
MGLAPYGRDRFVEAFRRLLRPDAERLYRVGLEAFAYPRGRTRMGGARFAAVFGDARAPGGPITTAHEDLARAAQTALEEVVLEVAGRLREQTRATHLGLSGGIFLNCVLNGRLLRETGFESVFVFPAAGDSGAAAGAAALVARMERDELRHAFWGDAFAQEEIDRALEGRPHRVVADPGGAAAEALARGSIVGWFSGRMEFGPRALGARSILADPREAGIRERVNRTVKFREDFRPFAPAVLEEAATEWFEGARPSPFMLLTFRARPEVRERIPGVVHVDGSARVQTVGREDGPAGFRRLLERFDELTGVPMVLNTSFNVRGEPIVRTPEEALAVFDRSALDVLVLEDRLVDRC